MRSINLFDIDYLYFINFGRQANEVKESHFETSFFRNGIKASAKIATHIITFISSLFDSHVVNTFSILCPDVHRLGEKTDYSISCWV